MNKFLTYGLAFASLIFAAGCSQTDHADHDRMEGAAATEATMPVDTTAAADGVATVYTCPMHPEVVSNTPGSCPKCGMDLEVK